MKLIIWGKSGYLNIEKMAIMKYNKNNDLNIIFVNGNISVHECANVFVCQYISRS